jgi:hypothetical protein
LFGFESKLPAAILQRELIVRRLLATINIESSAAVNELILVNSAVLAACDAQFVMATANINASSPTAASRPADND